MTKKRVSSMSMYPIWDGHFAVYCGHEILGYVANRDHKHKPELYKTWEKVQSERGIKC